MPNKFSPIATDTDIATLLRQIRTALNQEYQQRHQAVTTSSKKSSAKPRDAIPFDDSSYGLLDFPSFSDLDDLPSNSTQTQTTLSPKGIVDDANTSKITLNLGMQVGNKKNTTTIIRVIRIHVTKADLEKLKEQGPTYKMIQDMGVDPKNYTDSLTSLTPLISRYEEALDDLLTEEYQQQENASTTPNNIVNAINKLIDTFKKILATSKIGEIDSTDSAYNLEKEIWFFATVSPQYEKTITEIIEKLGTLSTSLNTNKFTIQQLIQAINNINAPDIPKSQFSVSSLFKGIESFELVGSVPSTSKEIYFFSSAARSELDDAHIPGLTLADNKYVPPGGGLT